MKPKEKKEDGMGNALCTTNYKFDYVLEVIKDPASCIPDPDAFIPPPVAEVLL
jgi:hypothetical protein